MSIELTIRLPIEGIHFWPGAPDPVEFLAYPHRHVFNYTFVVEVGGEDREVEFLTFREIVRAWIFKTYKIAMKGFFHGPRYFGARSCETLARELLDAYPQITQATVDEDGENGATVCRS